MSGEFPVNRDTWVAIEPVISETVECLSRRLKFLEKDKANRAELAKQVEGILAKKELPEGASEAKKVVECPLEPVDIDWRPRVDELFHLLRGNDLHTVAENIKHRLDIIKSSVPPKPTSCPEDATAEEVKALSDDLLAHYRGRLEAEEKAVRWLLEYLQAVQSEQAKPPAGKTEKGSNPAGSKGRRKSAKKPGGQRKFNPNADKKIADIWKIAKRNGAYKVDFARSNGLSLVDFDRLLNRVRKAKS